MNINFIPRENGEKMANASLHLQVACLICGTIYTQIRSDQIYCSDRCNSIAWRMRKEPVVLSCRVCSKQFNRISSKHQYCSMECQKIAEKELKKQKNNGLTKAWSKGKQFVSRMKCKSCGNMFYTAPCYKRRGVNHGTFCSRSCAMKDKNNWHFGLKSPRGKGGKRADINNQFFRSTWEANYARYLNWLIEQKEINKWEYETDTFEFIPIKRGSKYYTPDFKVWVKSGEIEYHEVKGWMDARSATKLKRMTKYYPKVKLHLIDKKVYQDIKNKVSRLISNWE